MYFYPSPINSVKGKTSNVILEGKKTMGKSDSNKVRLDLVPDVSHSPKQKKPTGVRVVQQKFVLEGVNL